MTGTGQGDGAGGGWRAVPVIPEEAGTPPPRREIRLFPDYGRDWPLWEDGGPGWDVGYATDPQLYGLSPELTERMAAWNRQWDEHFDPFDGWDSAQAREGWRGAGEEIAARLREEVVDFADVSYEPWPVQDPPEAEDPFDVMARVPEGSRPRLLKVDTDGAVIAVTDLGGEGPPLLLLHGLAGSSREMVQTAVDLSGDFHVLLMDQRGHGHSTRRPADVSREAFVDDAVRVLEETVPGQPCTLVGQSMGAHTAFLAAAARPDLVDRLVMLEGHVAGGEPGEAEPLGEYFASWSVPFTDEAAARQALGDGAIVDAWIDDLERTPEGLRPRFDADVMQRVIEAVHVPRWAQWEALEVPTLVIFAKQGMFGEEAKDELVRRRPGTARIDLPAGSHDAHLDAYDAWIEALRGWLLPGSFPGRETT